MLLQVKNIDVAYDEFQVIWNVSISIDQGEMILDHINVERK